MSIWVKCMYVYGVWMCVRVFWSVQALYGAANALCCKFFKRQNSTYLTCLKHQNTKPSLYKPSKNHWFITLLEIFIFWVRQKKITIYSLFGSPRMMGKGDVTHGGPKKPITC